MSGSVVPFATRQTDWTLVLAAAVLTAIVLSIFPASIVPEFPHDDSTMHLFSGAAISFFIASFRPRWDDIILTVAFLMGVVWEPMEAWYFICHKGRDPCRLAEFVGWMLGEDTVLDIALVLVGSFLALLIIGRYE